MSGFRATVSASDLVTGIQATCLCHADAPHLLNFNPARPLRLSRSSLLIGELLWWSLKVVIYVLGVPCCIPDLIQEFGCWWIDKWTGYHPVFSLWFTVRSAQYQHNLSAPFRFCDERGIFHELSFEQKVLFSFRQAVLWGRWQRSPDDEQQFLEYLNKLPSLMLPHCINTVVSIAGNDNVLGYPLHKTIHPFYFTSRK